jgi:hypothetical protein
MKMPSVKFYLHRAKIFGVLLVGSLLAYFIFRVIVYFLPH